MLCFIMMYCIAVQSSITRCSFAGAKTNGITESHASSHPMNVMEHQSLTIFERDLSKEIPSCEYFTNHKLLSTQRDLADYGVTYPPEQTFPSMEAQYSEVQQCDAASLIHSSVDYSGGRASWVDSFSSRNTFIASQAPLNVDQGRNFWDMVWFNNVHVIAMLTRPVEDGALKSAHYWPTMVSQKMVFRGAYKYTITALSIEDAGDTHGYVCVSLNIQKGNGQAIRPVTHCLFTEWPDMAVPRHTKSLLEFRKRVKQLSEEYAELVDTGPDALPPPIIVHCMAGLGRTGAFIAIDVLIERMEREAGRPVDLAGVVIRLRLQRPHAVLSEQQYKFIATAAMNYQ